MCCDNSKVRKNGWKRDRIAYKACGGGSSNNFSFSNGVELPLTHYYNQTTVVATETKEKRKDGKPCIFGRDWGLHCFAEKEDACKLAPLVKKVKIPAGTRVATGTFSFGFIIEAKCIVAEKVEVIGDV